MNNHRSYLDWELGDLLMTMNKPGLFFDGWRMFEPADITNVQGVAYAGVGMPWRFAGEGKSGSDTEQTSRNSTVKPQKSFSPKKPAVNE